MVYCRTATPIASRGPAPSAERSGHRGIWVIAGEITRSAVLRVFWALLADYLVKTLA
jgi:hypothetical protein